MKETSIQNPHTKDEYLIRVDKNLSKHSIDWIMNFGEDTLLCFDILIYIMSCSQKNLFQYGTIDLDNFAKEMGYNKSNLQRIRDNINKVSLEERLEGNKPVTIFEQALFKLAKTNFQYSTTIYDPSRHETIEKNQFIQIIRNINIHIPNGRVKTKIYYTYTTSEEFEYNLARFFFFIDPTQIKQLREKNLVLLYLYVKNLENSKFATFLEIDFNKICQISGISTDNIEDIKNAKDKLRTRKLNVLKNYIDYDFEFVKVSGRYKYGIKFIFPNNTKILNDPEFKKIATNKDQLSLQKANTDYIDLKLIKYCQENFNNYNEADYRAWFNNNTRDLEVKLDIFFSCISELYHITKVKAKEKHYNDALNFFHIK